MVGFRAPPHGGGGHRRFLQAVSCALSPSVAGATLLTFLLLASFSLTSVARLPELGAVASASSSTGWGETTLPEVASVGAQVESSDISSHSESIERQDDESSANLTTSPSASSSSWASRNASRPAALGAVLFDPADPTLRGKRYFLPQPSGGFGNQRLILRWSIVAANAMKRTLMVPPLAPHSDIWHGYNAFAADELVPASRVLDVRALTEAVDEGVVFLTDTPERVFAKAQEAGYSGKQIVKPHYKYVGGQKRQWWWREEDIRRDWVEAPEEIVFWARGSMWCCCGTTDPADYVWYTRHIMFNSELKGLAQQLAAEINPSASAPFAYNAVHVRRGDHTSRDRASAGQYYTVHRLDRFDKSLPLYVATDEPDPDWFAPWRTGSKPFSRLVFWKDLSKSSLMRFLDTFPEAMRSDVTGFVEQLLCGLAVKWEGSIKSTFSASIGTIRVLPALRDVSWSLPIKPSLRPKDWREAGAEQVQTADAEIPDEPVVEFV